MYFQVEKKLKAYHIIRENGLSWTPHLHTHIEIVLLHKGKSHAVADMRGADMSDGDLFIAFPNQIHYYHDKCDDVNATVLILSPDMCPEFSKIFKTMIPTSPVLKNAADDEIISQATEGLVKHRHDRGDFIEPLIRGYVLTLMSEVLRKLEFVDKQTFSTDLVKDIISYCYENFDSDISLQSVADALHISRYYISHLFSKRLEIGFNDYINSLRIRAACEMLKTNDKSITDIAYSVGYNSARTFNRCFMSIKKMTPKEYQKIKISKKEKENAVSN